MEMQVFTVYDMKAQFFGQPFFEQQEASAIRAFGDAVNDQKPGNQWNLHPEDFQLYLIGSFDNETGKIQACLPKALVMGSSLSRALRQMDLPGLEKNGEKAPAIH